MKIVHKNTLLERKMLCGLYIFIGVTHVTFLQSQTLSFHTLFPATWYEKGLNATVSVWHRICAVIDEKNDDFSVDAFDVILGRFAFAHFCLEKMYQHKQRVIDEDILYLANVLYAIEMRLIENCKTVKNCERFACLSRMVERTKRLLHPPSNL